MPIFMLDCKRVFSHSFLDPDGKTAELLIFLTKKTNRLLILQDVDRRLSTIFLFLFNRLAMTKRRWIDIIKKNITCLLCLVINRYEDGDKKSPLALVLKSTSNYGINVKMVMIMNVINLKTLSLSALMTSTMFSGAFAMENDPQTPVGNVRAARAMFEQGQSPAKQEKKTSTINFRDDIAKATGPSVRTAGTLFDQGKSPVKQENEAPKIDFMKDIKDAEGNGSKYLQARTQILTDTEYQSQVLQKKIEEFSISIPAQQKLLQDLQAEITQVEQATADFQKGILISKNNGIGFVLTTASSFISEKLWGNTSQTPQPVTNSATISANSTEEPLQPASKTSPKELSITAGDKGAEELFCQELISTKAIAETQLRELQIQLDSLEIDISSARKTLEMQKAVYERTTKGAEDAKSEALLTTSQLSNVAASITTTAYNFNPISYFWSNPEEKK